MFSRTGRPTSMLLTAGLLSLLRCRCTLAAGDLAPSAAAAHSANAAAAASTHAAAIAPQSLASAPLHLSSAQLSSPSLFSLGPPPPPPPAPATTHGDGDGDGDWCDSAWVGDGWMDGDASGGGEWSGRGGVEAAPALFTGNWGVGSDRSVAIAFAVSEL